MKKKLVLFDNYKIKKELTLECVDICNDNDFEPGCIFKLVGFNEDGTLVILEEQEVSYDNNKWFGNKRDFMDSI